MYTRIGLLALLALLVVSPPCRAGDALPVFSPPGGGGAGGERGHFIEQGGATLYRAICQGCHMPDARGAQGAGMYPALAANPRLAAAMYPAITVLQGRRGMPAFADSLTDEQVADLVNYVRSHFDNRYPDSVTPGDITRVRASLPSAGGAP